MKSNIFREYDIRGIVGKDFPIKETHDLVKSIISYFKKKDPKLTSIVIGMDGRTHSEQIKQESILAAKELGIDVIDIGLVPTPVFYFSLFHLKTRSGFIITASHNPKEYNGIKICLDKKSVWGKEIQEIKKIYESKTFCKKNSKLATKIEYKIIPKYVDWIVNHFKHLKNMSLNVVIDCANATGGMVFPQLIKKMNWPNVKLLFDKIDGTFPNHEADPTTYKNMKFVLNELKTNTKLELGIGLDGDCDRMNPMTKKGILIPGDQLLAIYAKKVVETYPGAAIVFDIKSSSGLIELLRKWKAKDIISASGHSLIKNALLKNKALLAGELSCHFFFNDRYFGYDDGIYAALRLFEIIKESNKNLDELIKIFPKKINSPEIRIKCDESKKRGIIEKTKLFFATKKDIKNITIDGIRAETSYGWGLARASNTQPVISLRFESNTQTGIKKIKSDFFHALKHDIDEKILKEKVGI